MNIFNVKFHLMLIWTLLDPIYYCFTRLKYLEDEERNRHIFRIRLTKYKGREITLEDGTCIKKNDVLLKIHLHNVRLLKELRNTKSELRKARMIYKHVEESMPILADYLKKHPNFDEVKGIVGITLLTKGVQRLGFETFSISNRWYERFKMLVAIPIYFLSVSNLSLDTMKNQRPKYLFMSKNNLINRYSK